MCGIFGSITKDKIDITDNILPHRGPDDWGVEYVKINNGYVTLFQSRLSIIGLGKQGHQPFTKNNKDFLVYNGEIFNYVELKDYLIDNFAVEFKTETDTEVLYELLLNLNIDEVLDKLNGMFAFSFLSEKEKKVFIARDQVGIKPLYYYKDDTKLLFSSEIKSFFNLNQITPELDRSLLGEYFANGWIYEPHTLFKDIYKLECAHYLSFDYVTKSLNKVKYWDIQSNPSEKVSIEKVVENQLVSDVPIGLYFSGGIDSSILSYLLKDKDVLNLNLNLNDSESTRVKLFRDKFDIKLKQFGHREESLDLYSKLIYFLDEPIADPAVIPAYELAQQSRQNKRIVMLSGMGGDELDAGYTRHKVLKNLLFYKIVKFIPVFIIDLFFKDKKQRDLKRLKAFMVNSSPENYFSLTSYFSENEINKLVGKGWVRSYKNKIRGYTENFKGLKKYFILDYLGFLSSHNLIYMDKASMAASVEVRVPLLDKNLVSYYFNSIDNKNNIGKKRLISELKLFLKESFAENKKEGFRYPIEKWIKNDINWSEIISYFEDIKIIDTGLLKTWVSKIPTNYREIEMKLWCIYTLYLWIEKFKVKIPCCEGQKCNK